MEFVSIFISILAFYISFMTYKREDSRFQEDMHNKERRLRFKNQIYKMCNKDFMSSSDIYQAIVQSHCDHEFTDNEPTGMEVGEAVYEMLVEQTLFLMDDGRYSSNRKFRLVP